MSAPAPTIQPSRVTVTRDYRVNGAAPLAIPSAVDHGAVILPELLWVEFRDGRLNYVGIRGPRLLANGKPGRTLATAHFWANILPGLEGLPDWAEPYTREAPRG